MVFLLFGFAQAFAQADNPAAIEKWQRIESADKEFSVALPPGGITDAEERDYGQKLKYVAFRNGVQMELNIIKDETRVKNRLIGLQQSVKKNLTLSHSGGFSILKYDSAASDQTFGNSIWIAKKDTMYILKVEAPSIQAAEVARFLYSINIQGKPLIVQKEKTNFPEETVSVSALKTSPEVTEAFSRKPEKNNSKTIYEVSSDDLNAVETAGLSRKAVILDRPAPRPNPGMMRGGGSSGSFVLKLKVNLLANGQIGDITVLSVVNKEFTQACLEATRKIRFVPAQKDGQNVDSVQLIDYTFQIFAMPGRVTR